MENIKPLHKKEDLVAAAMGKTAWLLTASFIALAIIPISFLIWIWAGWFYAWRSALTGLVAFIFLFGIFIYMKRQAEIYVDGLIAQWKKNNPE